jgi:hypothetical protein
MQHLAAYVDEVNADRAATLVEGLIADGLVERRGQLVRLYGD